MNNYLRTSFVFLLLFSLMLPIFGKERNRVLYIASYHPGFPTFFQQVEGIKDGFGDSDILLDIEFMDTKRYPEKENWAQFVSLLSYKLSRVDPYDAIVVADDNALILALDQQERLFENVPIVFLGVNNITRALKQNRNPQITGVVEAVSMKETIRLIIAQQEAVKNIIAIVDGTTSGQSDLKQFFALQDSFPTQKFSTIDLRELTWSEFETTLRRVKNNSGVLLLSAYKDKNGEALLFEESLQKIRTSISEPVYHLWEHGIGDGLIGGKVISHYSQGKTAGQIVAKIVSGTHIEDLKVIDESPNQFTFDYRQLEKHSIPHSLLPENSILLHKPHSFYEENRGIIVNVIIIISILVLALLIAISSIIKLKRVEKELRLSESKFRLLTQNLPTVMLYQLAMYPDGTRKFIYVSENIKDINKVSVEAALTDVNTLYGQIDEAQISSVIEKENTALANMETFDFEARMFLPSGDERWFQLTSTPHKEADGTVIWDGAEIDITERIESNKEIHTLRNYLSSIIDSMPSILICVDENESVTHWNKKAKESIALSDEQIAGKKLSHIFPAMEEYIGKIQKSIHKNRIFSEQKRAVESEKGTIYEKVTIYPLRSSDLKGAVVRIDDVTKETNLETELNHSRKMDAIGQLAGGVAHDFNNMLAGIIGTAEIMKMPQKNLSDENQKYIDLILNAALRSSELTQKLLAFGRKGKVFSTEVDFHTIIDDTLAIVTQSIDKKITIKVLKGATSSFVVGDNAALQNALMNLCINASHAMKDGGNLTVTTTNLVLDKQFCEGSSFPLTPGSYIEIAVADTGCGIAPQNVGRIFEPFFTTKGEGEGTGLGLSAVYATILEHHGSISVLSNPNSGTVFHICLPCSDYVSMGSSSADVSYQGRGTVLLVDDEEILRISGQQILESMGFTVLLACDGSEAVGLFSKRFKDIQLVIMDMIMPKMSGKEAFKQMKEIDPNCRVIISSGFTKDEKLNDLFSNGLAGFINKPFTTHELGKILSSTLSDTNK